ncbi:LTA synthase family protein [Massilibacterium senegalense]|uniref:LTA synthase family protein n=1 Tax=Massilibacterium senegalense TaxID=1632858 RepID=UPI000782EAE2|nr:LTA synthase family protein [Massilibacterium senegalense]
MKKWLISLKNEAPFFSLIVLLLWIKTYITYKTSFNIPMDNLMQEFILFINPLSFLLFVFGISLLFKETVRKKVMVTIAVTISILLYANVVYYRFFNDFITLPVLFQTSNMGDLGSSIHSLIKPIDLFYFADLFILYFVLKKKKLDVKPLPKKLPRQIIIASIVVFVINLGLAEIQRPQLLTRSFDRQMLVKNLGTFNYHIYDIVIQTQVKSKKVFADGSELTDVENYVKANYTEPDKELFGIAKGKNVILISLESTQNFLINYKLNGEEVTPFLNDLVKDSYYFDHFYHQTGQGKTSDAEFLIDNSLYPLARGAVFFTHSQNQYEAMPKILKENGYETAVFHANNKSFWNRDLMYQAFGYDRFFGMEDYSLTEENQVGWGLKDKEFFEQSLPLMNQVQQPFYGKFLMLTNHFPFTLNQEDQLLSPTDALTNDKIVNQYFQTVRYEDEAVKEFFTMLKEKGYYNNSIIVLYGDHYGISQNHNEAMGQLLGKEITPFEAAELQKVPFIIHIPGEEGKTIHTVGGQVDIRPTILHLLGIQTKNQIQFGHDLLSPERKGFAAFRDGSFVTDEFIYTEETCYNKADGTPVEKEKCEPYFEKINTELDFSDSIIYGDLFRFTNAK